MTKIYIVIRSYDWGDYGNGSEIVKAFYNKAKADEKAVELKKTETGGGYGYTYAVEATEIE